MMESSKKQFFKGMRLYRSLLPFAKAFQQSDVIKRLPPLWLDANHKSWVGALVKYIWEEIHD